MSNTYNFLEDTSIPPPMILYRKFEPGRSFIPDPIRQNIKSDFGSRLMSNRPMTSPPGLGYEFNRNNTNLAPRPNTNDKYKNIRNGSESIPDEMMKNDKKSNENLKVKSNYQSTGIKSDGEGKEEKYPIELLEQSICDVLVYKTIQRQKFKQPQSENPVIPRYKNTKARSRVDQHSSVSSWNTGKLI